MGAVQTTAGTQIDRYLGQALKSSNFIQDPKIARFFEDQLLDMFRESHPTQVAKHDLIVAGSDMPRGRILAAADGAAALGGGITSANEIRLNNATAIQNDPSKGGMTV